MNSTTNNLLILPGEIRNELYDVFIQDLKNCSDVDAIHVVAGKLADSINFSGSSKMAMNEFGPLLLNFLRDRRFRIEVLVQAFALCYENENPFITELENQAIEIRAQLDTIDHHGRTGSYSILPALRFLRAHPRLKIVFQKDNDCRESCAAMNNLTELVRADPNWAETKTKDILSVELRVRRLGPVRYKWCVKIRIVQPLNASFFLWNMMPKGNPITRTTRRYLELGLREWEHDWSAAASVDIQ